MKRAPEPPDDVSPDETVPMRRLDDVTSVGPLRAVSAPAPAAIHSALRPRVAPSFSLPAPPSSERVLGRLGDVATELEPHASEARVAEVYLAALRDLLPQRTLRLDLVDRPARAVDPLDLDADDDESGARHAALEVPAAAGDRDYAVIAIEPGAAPSDLALDAAVAGAVAPFLAAALRAARALAGGHDAVASRAQLVRADKLATIGQFAAEIVHDFNNPLTTIIAYADALARHPGQAPGDRTRLQRIGEAGQRIRDLARRLLEYARPARAVDPAISVVDVLEQAVAFCEHVVTQTGAHVERDFAPGLPRVRAVRGELAQVFVNLITNACHAVDGGGGRVVLGARGDANGRVRVTVEDNGRGIAPADLPRIFEPFFTTKGDAGTGLGLAIVQRVLDTYGAHCAVESEPGRGTRFVVELLPATEP